MLGRHTCYQLHHTCINPQLNVAEHALPKVRLNQRRGQVYNEIAKRFLRSFYTWQMSYVVTPCLTSFLHATLTSSFALLSPLTSQRYIATQLSPAKSRGDTPVMWCAITPNFIFLLPIRTSYS